MSHVYSAADRHKRQTNTEWLKKIDYQPTIIYLPGIGSLTACPSIYRCCSSGRRWSLYGTVQTGFHRFLLVFSPAFDACRPVSSAPMLYFSGCWSCRLQLMRIWLNWSGDRSHCGGVDLMRLCLRWSARDDRQAAMTARQRLTVMLRADAGFYGRCGRESFRWWPRAAAVICCCSCRNRSCQLTCTTSCWQPAVHARCCDKRRYWLVAQVEALAHSPSSRWDRPLRISSTIARCNVE